MTAKAVNFRASGGFVTDGSGETYTAETSPGNGQPELYPTTRAGHTFGWDTLANLNVRDRNSGVDRRCAGTHWSQIGLLRTWRLDLDETGDHAIELSIGDATHAGGADWQLFDDTTKIIDFGPSLLSFSGGQFYDASQTLRTSASDWAANEVAVTKTFASTILKITAGNNGTGSISNNINHVKVTYVPPAGFPKTLMQYGPDQGRPYTALRM